MSALLDNPAYKAVRVLQADWDDFKKTSLASDLEVRHRSTLITFAKGNEVDRVVSVSGQSDIEALFKNCLAAAT